MSFVSPLRYPGGKRKLANYIKLIFHTNRFLDGDYVEPYAGGASVSLSLLFEEYVRRIYINDIDPAVFAFWYAVLNETDALCQRIIDTPVTMEEWYIQKQVQANADASLLERGFSTFFLNRTNRSGIISGGVIGGKDQTGKWLLDARYNKANLTHRIRKISRYRHRIHLYNLDAIEFLTVISNRLPQQSLVYLDPPYFVKGQQQLYTNWYVPENHIDVANYVRNLGHNWIVSYDDVPEIRSLYSDFRRVEYDIHYSAQVRYRGNEIMFFCDGLEIPEVIDPAKVKGRQFQPYLM